MNEKLKTINFKNIKLITVTGLMFVIGTVFSQNKITPKDIRLDATYEHISVLWEINDDNNHNSNLEIAYRVLGTATYLQGAKTLRAYPEMKVNNTSLNKNYLAGSVLFLEPGTAYELKLSITDPDGGSITEIRTISTKTPLKHSSTGSIYYVAPGSGGGNGTKSTPFLGLQMAADNAVAGDLFLILDGLYKPFTITADGTVGNPIVFKSKNLHGAIIDGANTSAGIVNIGDFSKTTEYLIVDGFVIQNGHWAINAENTAFVTIKNNKIKNVGYGYYNRRENGWEHDQTIENNEFTGTTSWPQSGIPSERCIDIRGNNNVVRYNTIQYFGDGISTDGRAVDVSYSMDIYYNDIAYCVDDGIEIDFTIANSRVYRNRVYNSRTGTSLAPVLGGPCYIFRNEFFNIEDGFSAHKMNRSPAGLIIVHNTSNKNGNGLSSPSGWQNTYLRNNIIMGTEYVFEEFGLVSGSTDDWDYNAYFSERSGTNQNEWFKWSNIRYENIGALQAGTDIEANGIAITMADLKNANLPTNYVLGVVPGQRDLELTDGSAAINSGVAIDNLNLPFVFDGQADRGAYEFGQPYPLFGVNFDKTTPPYHNTEKAYSVFPNPTSDLLHFNLKGKSQFNESIEWTFFNLQGQHIKTSQNNQSTIDIRFLIRGIYLVKIKVGKRLIVEKIQIH
ncbi:T9SS type A sorting domain-containing protein [Tenacibaculum ovolyticum]|uniref:T9SS type A sorting domain-containing protein n=1 Tax=Tenacibaculum ovolyticum TaxID=104270 RepID=UPI0022F3E952|nr:T9SS type A sorting domain-containing protein [Tenacibaculum ovolyticum]WBX75663.1 T9SS type A sorting domain-containing protein [Tenacibaculum ovolyticum]